MGIVGRVNELLQAFAAVFSRTSRAMPGARRLVYVSWGRGGGSPPSWKRVSMGRTGERPATLEISECSKATGGRELSRTYIVSDAEMAAFARFVESLYLGQWATEETLGDDLREATTLSLWYSPRLHPVTLSDAGALPPGVSQTIDRIREVMERHAKPSRLVEG